MMMAKNDPQFCITNTIVCMNFECLKIVIQMQGY
jgi:hypothetical protein